MRKILLCLFALISLALVLLENLSFGRFYCANLQRFRLYYLATSVSGAHFIPLQTPSIIYLQVENDHVDSMQGVVSRTSNVYVKAIRVFVPKKH